MFKVRINGTEYNADVGINQNETLDETLDSGKLEINFLASESEFKPFDFVELIDYNEDTETERETIQMVIETDQATLQKRKNGTFYKHIITLIQTTERLKFMVLSNKSFTTSFNIQEPTISQSFLNNATNCIIKIGSQYIENKAINKQATQFTGQIKKLYLNVGVGTMFSESNNRITISKDSYTKFNKNGNVYTTPQIPKTSGVRQQTINKRITQGKIGDFVINPQDIQIVVNKSGTIRTFAITETDNLFSMTDYLEIKSETVEAINDFVGNDTCDIYLDFVSQNKKKEYVDLFLQKVLDNKDQFGITSEITNQWETLTHSSLQYHEDSLDESSPNTELYGDFLTLNIDQIPYIAISFYSSMKLIQGNTIFDKEWESDFTLWDILNQIKDVYYEENKTYPFYLESLENAESGTELWKHRQVLETYAPEISFVQSSVYQALADLFLYINAVPTLTRDSNGHFQLDFEYLEKEGNDISNEEITSSESSVMDSNFVNASVGNIQQSVLLEENRTNITSGIKATTNNLGIISETDGAWGYDLGQPIYKIKKVYIKNATWDESEPTPTINQFGIVDYLEMVYRTYKEIDPIIPAYKFYSVFFENELFSTTYISYKDNEKTKLLETQQVGSAIFDISFTNLAPIYIFLWYGEIDIAESDFLSHYFETKPSQILRDLDITDFVLNDDIYSILPSNLSVFESGKMYQQNVLHYKRGDRWVYFSYFNNNSYFVIQDFISVFKQLLSSRLGYYNLYFEGQENGWKGVKLAFEFVPEVNCRYKSFTDQKNYKGEILVNSQQLLTNTQRLLNNLFGLALKFGSPNKTVQYGFRKFKERLRKGDYIVDSENNYWVANIVNNEIVRKDGLVQSKISLVRNYNKLSQFIKINQEKRYFQINEKLVVESERNYTIFMYFGCDIDTETQDTLNNMPNEQFYVDTDILSIENFTKQIACLGKIDVWGSHFGKNITNNDIFMPFRKFGGGNSIVFSCMFNEPVVAYRKINLVSPLNSEGIFYANKGDGSVENGKITFWNTCDLDMPYVSNVSPSGLKIENINKNANEILKANLQVVFLPTIPNRIIFGSAIIDRNNSIYNPVSIEVEKPNVPYISVYYSTTDKVFQRNKTQKIDKWYQNFELFTDLTNKLLSNYFSVENGLCCLTFNWEEQFIKSIAIIDQYGELYLGVNINKVCDHIKIYFKATNFHL